VLDPTITTDEADNDDTHEAGTATTDEATHVVGIYTVFGTLIETAEPTKTHVDDGTFHDVKATDEMLLDGTETTDDEITETITVDGTLSGTELHYTTTVLDPTQTNPVDETTEETHDAGRATTELTGQESGITTVVGTTTTELDGNETIELDKTETTTLDGTEAGTDDH